MHLLEGPFAPAGGPENPEISVSCGLFYDVEKTLPLTPARSRLLTVSDFSRSLLRFIEENPAPALKPEWEEPSRADYEKAFAHVQNMIAQGQIDKAVPVVFARARATVTGAVRARWLLELMSAPENLHVHGWWDGERGVIGATPEILFSVDGRELRTMALAGTLAKADGGAVDLQRSAKDQHEHRLVVEDISRVLAPFGVVRHGETRVAELPTLWHLRTDFEVTLEEKPDLAHLVKTMHPTAALGVFPRVFGWRWLRELPGQDGRAFYGAPFTVRLSPTRAVSLVAIRNLQWEGDRLLLGSGGGLVKDSDLESEWRELQRKRESVLKIFGMAP